MLQTALAELKEYNLAYTGYAVGGGRNGFESFPDGFGTSPKCNM